MVNFFPYKTPPSQAHYTNINLMYQPQIAKKPAFRTLDRHQVANSSPSGAPAETGINRQDAFRPFLQDDLSLYSPPTLAGVVIMTQSQRWPGQFGKLLAIMGTSALVHGSDLKIVEGKSITGVLPQMGGKSFGQKAVF